MNAARFKISGQLLADCLRLPKGTEIRGLRQNDEAGFIDLEIIVEHPDLKPVEPGKPIPEINPMFTRHTERVDCDWGQK